MQVQGTVKVGGPVWVDRAVITVRRCLGRSGRHEAGDGGSRMGGQVTGPGGGSTTREPGLILGGVIRR